MVPVKESREYYFDTSKGSVLKELRTNFSSGIVPLFAVLNSKPNFGASYK
jgi:hypothetical protein